MARPTLERVSQREYARRLGVSNEAVSRAVKEGRIKRGWDAKGKKIIVQHANSEWGDVHIQQNAKKIVSAAPSSAADPVEDDQPPTGAEGGALNNNTSYANAKRIKEVASAQLTILELRQKKGELVDRQVVYKKLRDYGVSLRTEIMNIPNLCIDDIMSQPTRAGAVMVLTEALHKVLDKATSKKVDIE